MCTIQGKPSVLGQYLQNIRNFTACCYILCDQFEKETRIQRRYKKIAGWLAFQTTTEFHQTTHFWAMAKERHKNGIRHRERIRSCVQNQATATATIRYRLAIYFAFCDDIVVKLLKSLASLSDGMGRRRKFHFIWLVCVYYCVDVYECMCIFRHISVHRLRQNADYVKKSRTKHIYPYGGYEIAYAFGVLNHQRPNDNDTMLWSRVKR